MKNLFSILLLYVLSSCTQYHLVKVPNGEGGEKRLLYAYGNFCGGGWPIRLEEPRPSLPHLSPPTDDLDAICYAHDYCYDLTGTNKLTCDDALHTMVIRYQSRFIGPGCWNTATDLTIAFFGKFWEKGNESSETIANRWVGTLLGVPTALFWATLKAPVFLFLPVAEGHTCNLAQKSDPRKILKEFEEEYQVSIFSKNRRIVIEPPSNGG